MLLLIVIVTPKICRKSADNKSATNPPQNIPPAEKYQPKISLAGRMAEKNRHGV